MDTQGMSVPNSGSSSENGAQSNTFAPPPLQVDQPSQAQEALPQQPLAPTQWPQDEPALNQVATQDPTSTIGGAFVALRLAVTKIFRGDLVGALAVGESYRRFWIVAALSFIGATGFLGFGTGVAVSQGVDAIVSDVFGSGVRVSGSAFENGIQLFFLFALLAALFVFARITAMFALLKMRKVPITYGGVAAIWGVSVTPWLFLLVVAALLTLIPSGITVGLASIILILLVPATVFMSEIAIYVGLNRVAIQERSLLVPHTVFTGVALAVVGIIVFVVIESSVRSSW